MILSGLEIVARKLVSKWTSPATIDFDNTKRQAAEISPIPFDDDSTGHTITLPQGTYLVRFNESIKVPLNYMAQIYPRSSLWRSGVDISAGVVDAGYKGVLGALLDVRNPHGIILYPNAKLAQVVFAEMGESVEGYRGIYQSSTSIVGRDGMEEVQHLGIL